MAYKSKRVLRAELDVMNTDNNRVRMRLGEATRDLRAARMLVAEYAGLQGIEPKKSGSARWSTLHEEWTDKAETPEEMGDRLIHTFDRLRIKRHAQQERESNKKEVKQLKTELGLNK